MIDHRYRPKWLPQINAPYKYVLNALKEEGIKYLIQDVNPKKLKPSQGIVSLDKIGEMDVNNLKPYWVSEDNCILDGHHRHGSALTNDLPKTKIIRIMLPAKDAIRILNKIQDIYEYQKAQEGLSQDVLNIEKDFPVEANGDFLNLIENELEPNQEILHSGFERIDTKSNKKKMSAYRKNELKEGSQAGNFFSVKPIDGYIKYDIKFDNLLDTNDFGLTYNNEEPPTKKLAAIWFPNLDFTNIAQKLGADELKLINRAVSEKARKMGYDGIKYGDIIIQGL
jgi:hypothetical protein